jgi:Predicted transcriptional regulators
MDNFSDWLIERMRSRDWSQADLARESGLTRQAIGRYIGKKTQTPDEDALKKIAKAFEISPETAFRAAGILPSRPDADEEVDEIMEAVRRLNKADRPEILAFIRMKNNLRKKK